MNNIMNRQAFFSHKKLTALALAIASAMQISPALAQDPADDELEEIMVTGSRIRATNGMAEPTPVTTMTPIELQTFEPGGTVAEQLDALPQFFATGTAQRGGATLFDNGGGSYLSSHDPREILGVGSAAKIDSIEIRWPSGKVDRLVNPPMNKYVKVVEGTGLVSK